MLSLINFFKHSCNFEYIFTIDSFEYFGPSLLRLFFDDIMWIVLSFLFWQYSTSEVFKIDPKHENKDKIFIKYYFY